MRGQGLAAIGSTQANLGRAVIVKIRTLLGASILLASGQVGAALMPVLYGVEIDNDTLFTIGAQR